MPRRLWALPPQVLSLIVNYVCLVYHRAAARARSDDAAAQAAALLWPAGGSTIEAEAEAEWREATEAATERLADHVFEGQGLYYRFKFNRPGQRMVLGVVVLASLLTVIGAVVPSFEFMVHGRATHRPAQNNPPPAPSAAALSFCPAATRVLEVVP